MSKQAGSKDGGAGVLELFMRARWIGVGVGLGPGWPGRGGAALSPGSSPAR